MSEQHFKTLPKPHTTYANIIKSLLPLGDNDKASKDSLPDTTYIVDDLVIDQDNLADYRKICGFSNSEFVPPTYFCVLSQALQMNLMVKEPFPFAMLGLVHVENMVKQYQPIVATNTFKMTVALGNLRDHPKGQQFDFFTKVYEADTLIWEGSSTYLSRQRSRDRKAKEKNTTETQDSLNKTQDSLNDNPEIKTVPASANNNNALKKYDSNGQTIKPNIDENDIHDFWDVPEDIGRRYAFVSGDFNLIHLHPLSARAFGFPKAIAHGMWSKAKCLAQLGELPDSYIVQVSFKLPILLPSEVEFIAKYDNRDENIDFGLFAANSDKPHLYGHLHIFS